MFELLKEGEVLVVPTDNPMPEKDVWLAFRDVVLGLEYRECLSSSTFGASSLKQLLLQFIIRKSSIET